MAVVWLHVEPVDKESYRLRESLGHLSSAISYSGAWVPDTTI